MTGVVALPTDFAATRDALRSLACYVVSPARKQRTGRIGLVPHAGSFGTPALDDGRALVVAGDQLRWQPGDESVTINTLRTAAEHAGVELSDDPGVGNDLPPFAPEEPLGVDAASSRALADWYAFGAAVIAALGVDARDAAVSECTLWPEHFDLAAVVDLGDGVKVNVGFSPGDDFLAEPYVYVGPHDRSVLAGEFWNAPFGAVLPHSELVDVGDEADRRALQFIQAGLQASRR